MLRRCKSELLSEKPKRIIARYGKFAGKYWKSYSQDWLSLYYSPMLTALRQYLVDLEGKSVMEVGYGLPLFVTYLRSLGTDAVGIDIDPYITGEGLHKMSVERIPEGFKRRYAGRFDAIIERIALSKLYDSNYFEKTGRHRFRDRKRILGELRDMLKEGGLLVLQDDKGSVFTRREMSESEFRKVLNEPKIVFRDKRKKYMGWNTIVVYRKLKKGSRYAEIRKK